MRISKQLNLVIPLETEGHGKIFIHSTPISRDVFETYYLELGKVFSQCFDNANSSHMFLSAPKLAYPAIKKVAMDQGNWEGPGGVKFGLINTIKQQTNILVAVESGYKTFTFTMAVDSGVLDEEDEAEVLSSLCFFTAISRVAPKDLKMSFLQTAGSLRGWDITSLDFMEYQTSLPTLKTTENTTKKGKASSLPS